jgi:hypothetical protein
MSVNQIINELPTLFGIGVTSGLVSSLLTAFLTPRIQHRFWMRQQKFDSRFLNVKELHRLSVEAAELSYFQPALIGDTARILPLVLSWRAATQQTRFLFSEKATRDIAELDRAVVTILTYGLSKEGQNAQDVLGKFHINEHKVFEALYRELFAGRRYLWPFRRRFSWRPGVRPGSRDLHAAPPSTRIDECADREKRAASERGDD